jgi:hypothetical protein
VGVEVVHVLVADDIALLVGVRNLGGRGHVFIIDTCRGGLSNRAARFLNISINASDY